MHDGGEGVIGTGGHIDMIIGVDWFLGTQFASQDLDGTIGNDLIGIHVGLSAGTSLPDDEREVIDQFQACDLGRSLLDSLANFGI